MVAVSPSGAWSWVLVQIHKCDTTRTCTDCWFPSHDRGAFRLNLSLRHFCFVSMGFTSMARPHATPHPPITTGYGEHVPINNGARVVSSMGDGGPTFWQAPTKLMRSVVRLRSMRRSLLA